jgi:lipoprotein-anchoring transpeptidase ErfK/SrfK
VRPPKWLQLCADAQRSLAAGRKNEARRLAHQAAKAAPDKEEPWLLLAATASPRASIAYLKQALEINPRSQRARKGLRWAEERIVALAEPEAPAGALALPRFNPAWLFALLALAGVFIAFAWFRPAGLDDSLRLAGAAAAKEINLMLASDTPTATATATASPTHTATNTPEPTNTPTITPTPSASPTASPSPTPTAEFALAKQFLELPQSIGPSERWIEVNLTTQTLNAYEGDDLVRSFVISSGRPNTPTVVGEFRVWAKVRIQAMSGPGYYIEDVPWVMYFYGDYGIHGTWWHNNFGTPMSAGCVNMTIEDAQWMYNWASMGTVVQVHY